MNATEVKLTHLPWKAFTKTVPYEVWVTDNILPEPQKICTIEEVGEEGKAIANLIAALPELLRDAYAFRQYMWDNAALIKSNQYLYQVAETLKKAEGMNGF